MLYLMFNEGYLASASQAAIRRDLAEDAAWLTSLLAKLLPGQSEVVGLLALMRLHQARADARFDERGQMVLLQDQDRQRWDQPRIRETVELLEGAARLRRPGPYQLQAAIVACHASATSWQATDWRRIVALYDELCRVSPTPVTQLNRAIALAQLDGPAVALAALQDCAAELDRYHLYHAARAQFLADLGDNSGAELSLKCALELTANPAERALLERRLAALGADQPPIR